MKTFGWVLGAMAALGLAAQGRSGEGLKELTGRGLQGQYRIVAGEEGGKPIPESHHLQHSTVTFTPEMVIVFDRDRKQMYAAKYTLEGAKSPPVIHMVSTHPKEGMKADGLIQRKGDDVTIIYALPTGAMPKEFKTEGKQLMLRLKTFRPDDEKK